MASLTRRPGWLVKHVSALGFVPLWIEFVVLFVLVAFLFALLYWTLGLCLPSSFDFSPGPLCFTQAIFFSFMTQLTGGYGSPDPIGYSRILVVVQAMLGLGLFGLWAGIAVMRLMSAPANSLVFAPYAGYDKSTEAFFVVFVNRNLQPIVDVTLRCTIKLNEYNVVDLPHTPAYIGNSVWPLSFRQIPIADLATMRFLPGDGVKFSISGKLGDSSLVTYQKYTLDKVLVVPDRSWFQRDAFRTPTFEKQFWTLFNSPPDGALQFLDDSGERLNTSVRPSE